MSSAAFDPRLERLVQKVDPNGRLLRAWPLSGGMSARMTAFELRDASGAQRKLILRRPGAAALEQYPRAAQAEYDLLRTIHALGLPSPAPYLLDSSGEIFPTPYLVIEYMQGQTEFAPANLDSYTRQMAAQLARIHRVDGSRLGLEPLIHTAGEFSDAACSKPDPLNHALEEGRIRARLDAVWPLPARSAPALLHGDYWPGNLLWRGGRLVAVVDWEDAHLGDPLSDLAISRLDLACIFGAGAMEAFTQHYLALMPLDVTCLPDWDLWAALRFIRLAGADLEGWAAFYPPVGRPDVTAKTLRAAYFQFIAQAFDRLSAPAQE